MPGYNSREAMSAMSMSLADLNFDPKEPQKRRARNRTKRDALSQSCSAFNFVLDPSELAQTAEDKDVDKKDKKNKPKKPSYSDLVMDATAKTHSAQLGSPTSPIDEVNEREAKINQTGGRRELTKKESPRENPQKTSRSIPSSADFNRQRNLKSKSSHTSRKPRSHLSRSCHMSFDSFPEPEDFLAESDRLKPPSKGRDQERFSKSLSDVGDWDFEEEAATNPRRRGKKPLRSKSTDDMEFSPSKASELVADHTDLKKKNDFSDIDDFPVQKSRTKPSSRAKKGNLDRFSKSFSDFGDWDFETDAATPPKRRGKKPAGIKSIDGLDPPTSMDGSFNEMDLLKASAVSPNKKGSTGTRKQFSRSVADLDFSSQQNLGFLPQTLAPVAAKDLSQAPDGEVTRQPTNRSPREHEEVSPQSPAKTEARPRPRPRRALSNSSANDGPGLRRSSSRRHMASDEEKEDAAPARKPRNKRGSGDDYGSPVRQASGSWLRRSHADVYTETLRTAGSHHDVTRRGQSNGQSRSHRNGSPLPSKETRKASRRASEANVGATISAVATESKPRRRGSSREHETDSTPPSKAVRKVSRRASEANINAPSFANSDQSESLRGSSIGRSPNPPRTDRKVSRRTSEANVDVSTFVAGTKQEGPLRSSVGRSPKPSKAGRKVSRRASEANIDALPGTVAAQGQRRIPRRTKSGDGPVPSMRNQLQRSLSNDGSSLVRRAEASGLAEMRQASRRNISGAASPSRPQLARSMSGLAERRVARRMSRQDLSASIGNLSSDFDAVDRSVASGSSNEDSVESGTKSPRPRRKLPGRSKSHDGSPRLAGVPRLSSKDRLRNHRELKTSASKAEERNDD